MLIGRRMSSPAITVSPDTPIVDALALMKEKHIRRAPVVKDNKLVGIISDKDILNAAPTSNRSLSVWEMNYLLSKYTVKDIMTRHVYSVTEDTPIEEAARIMADNKIGGLPVVRNDEVVGIITETDLFKIFLELMGAREAGVRVTALIHERRGQLAHLTQAIASAGGNFVAFGQFTGADTTTRLLTFKIAGLTEHQVRAIVEPMVLKLMDIRTLSI